jgi:hypothetical protein
LKVLRNSSSFCQVAILGRPLRSLLAQGEYVAAQQIELSHHSESDNCEVMIKRVGETYSRTLHDHEAGCVDGGQFVEIGAPEIFPGPLQIAELARKDFQSAPPRHHSFQAKATSLFALRSRNVNVSMTTGMEV